MHKLLLSCSMALVAATAMGATLPYYSDLGKKATSSIDPDWTIINENTESKTWVYDGDDNNLTAVTGAPCGIVYRFDSSNAADDWAVSPALHLTPGVEYKVSFWFKTSSDTEDLTLYLTDSNVPDQMINGTVLLDFAEYKNSTWTKQIKTFTVSAEGDYRAAFYLHSPKNHYNVYLRGFTLSENVQVPCPVENLSVTPGADKALTADLTWTLPTLDTDGGQLTEPLQSVTVSRDGEIIATLAGDAVSYSDSAEGGLQPGFHTYAVYVTYQGQNSRAVEIATPYIGELQPLTLPWSCDLEDDYEWELWTVADPDNDGNAAQSPASAMWSRWRNTTLTGYQLVFSNPSNNVTENDWVFTPPFNFNGTGEYALDFEACMYSPYDNTCLLDVYLTNDTEIPVNDITPIATFDSFKSSTYPKDGDKITIPVMITTPGTYHIALYEHAEPETRQVRVDNFAVRPVDVTITSIDETAAEKLTYRNGIVFFPACDTITIYTIDGGIAARTVDSSFDTASLAPGLYIVRQGRLTVKILVK